MRNTILRLAVAVSILGALVACGPASEDVAAVSAAAKKPKTCLAADPLDLSTGAATVQGDSSAAKPGVQQCGNGPAEFYTFTVSAYSALYVDTFGSSFDTVVGLLDAGCSGAARSCADDACGAPQSQLFELVQPGTYHLLVAGSGALEKGPYTLHVRLVPMPSPPAGELPRGAFDLTGALSGYSGGRFGACGRGPFSWYWYLSCPGDSGWFTASTCNAETTFDSALSLLDAEGGAELCCDEITSSNPAQACAGPDLEAFPSQASVQVWEPPGAGLHVLKVGAVSVMRTPTTPYRIVGARP